MDVANTLWASCFFSIHFEGSLRFSCSLCYSLPINVDAEKLLRQMHQFLISCDLQEGLHAALPARLLALKEKCRAAFIGSPVQPSASQQQVSDTLRDMGLSVEDEFECPKSCYSIDMRVQDKCRDLGVGWAIEFDGPSHFFACKAPTGATLIKRRHLELLGYILVSMPYWEWDGLSGVDERRKYLEGKLQCHVGVDCAAHS